MESFKPEVTANCLRVIADAVENAESVSQKSYITINVDNELIESFAPNAVMRHLSSDRTINRVDAHIGFTSKPKNRNKQSGFVIEGVAIVLFALGVAIFGGFTTEMKSNRYEDAHQQQQIDNIKAGGLNDGKVDW